MKLIYLIPAAAVIFCPFPLKAGSLEQIRENAEKTAQLLEEEKRQHLKEKEQSSRSIKGMEERIKNLEGSIARLEEEIASLNREMGETEAEKADLTDKKNKAAGYFSNIKKDLLKNSLWLKKDIDSGLPFHKETRIGRIDDFNKRTEEQAVTDSLRELCYLFTAEMDLSCDSELYSEEIAAGKGEIKKAKFVRVGKNILAYRTNDGEEYGRWLNGKWERDLDSRCRKNIKKAIEILEGRRIPELLKFSVAIGSEGAKND